MVDRRWLDRLGHHFLIRPPVRFMLDQQRLRFLSTIDDLPNDDADLAAFLASVRLDRLAPTPI